MTLQPGADGDQDADEPYRAGAPSATPQARHTRQGSRIKVYRKAQQAIKQSGLRPQRKSYADVRKEKEAAALTHEEEKPMVESPSARYVRTSQPKPIFRVDN